VSKSYMRQCDGCGVLGNNHHPLYEWVRFSHLQSAINVCEFCWELYDQMDHLEW